MVNPDDLKKALEYSELMKSENFEQAKKLNLKGADLSDANLTGANLKDADIKGADLTNANLEGVDLSDARNI
jgi:uncharacterized protein YjbI with pentapeptide repeats